MNNYFRRRRAADQGGAGGGDDPIGDALRADAVAYWKMDEASGTRADATGNGVGLSDNNSVGSSTGKIGNSAVFVNSSQQWLLSSSSVVSAESAAFTIFGWVKLPPIPSQSEVIFSHLDDVSQADRILVDTSWNNTTQKYRLDIYVSLPDFNVDGVISNIAHAFNPNEWHFFIAGYDSSNQRVFISVDNLADVTKSISAVMACNGPVAVGAYALAEIYDIWLDGEVDELGVIGRVATTDERAYLYNSGTGRTLYP